MSQGMTARTAVALLTAALLALPFFAAPASFATAHTSRHAEAKAQPGIKPSVKALRDETLTQRHCDIVGGPTGPLRVSDRHRAVGFTLLRPERPLPAQDSPAVRKPVPPGASPMSKPPTAHSPAALQVFRC
jgi:hypothetical protein